MPIKSTLFLLFFASLLQAQSLPVQSVTLFKNGRAMIQREGQVSAKNSVYSTRELPDALFGTFWIGAPGNNIKSVFTQLDSVMTPGKMLGTQDYYKGFLGKKVKITLQYGSSLNVEQFEGSFESMLPFQDENKFNLLFHSKEGVWMTVNPYELKRVEFSEKPNFIPENELSLKKRMDIAFSNGKTEQDLSLSYLIGDLGWTPVYRLELKGKDKGKLSLRAEIVNDAEDLGAAPELRLAVGVPNFAYATRAASLVDFNRSGDSPINPYRGNAYNGNTIQAQFSNAYDPNSYETINAEARNETEQDPQGSQVEDYYFYSIRPGKMPKGSRYQSPIFDLEIETSHFFECKLPDGGPNRLQAYRNNSSNPDTRNAVNHFVEFKNSSNYPWTTGAVNLLSGADLQPISQDLLPYTAPGAKCKVRIAETPEIKVTQTEGDIKREENVQKFFNRQYDRVTIEGQVCVVNYKKEPVTLKIKRKIEGQPTKSSDQDWRLTQEAATLRVNSEYNIEWEITLKPGEEKKWKYQYEVFVDF